MSSRDDVFLEEARLGPRTQVLIDCEEVPHIPRLVRRFREYVLTDLAHAVMLSEAGILSKERGARLLGGLMEIHDSGGEGFPWLPQSGSFLVQTEHYLGERIGEDIAGRLQTGRSRNDQSAAAERIFLRDMLLAVADETIALQGAVLDQAERHAVTLMPGYTHLQHAQPTTFGHHLMRYGAGILALGTGDVGRADDDHVGPRQVRRRPRVWHAHEGRHIVFQHGEVAVLDPVVASDLFPGGGVAHPASPNRSIINWA